MEGNCVLETSIETRRKPQRRSGDPGWACFRVIVPRVPNQGKFFRHTRYSVFCT